ncbi:MAG: hypothetical protein HYX60_02590 [Legionella longbeachae]|nr:hypothetical protein [Legionella longbeachae]
MRQFFDKNLSVFLGEEIGSLLYKKGKFFKEFFDFEQENGLLINHFLLMRIRTLSEIYIREKVNQSQSEYVKDIKCELNKALEMVRIGFIIDIIMAIQEKNEIIDKKIYTIFAKDILNRLKELKVNETFCFPAAWQGHAIYVNFTKIMSNKLILRIDNLGQGSNYKSYHYEDENERLYSAVRQPISLDNKKVQKKIMNYLANLIETAVELKKVKKGCENIYDGMKPFSKKMSLNKLKQSGYVTEKEQTGPTCTYTGTLPGLRLGLKDNFNRFIQQEKELVKELVDLNDTIKNQKKIKTGKLKSSHHHEAPRLKGHGFFEQNLNIVQDKEMDVFARFKK